MFNSSFHLKFGVVINVSFPLPIKISLLGIDVKPVPPFTTFIGIKPVKLLAHILDIYVPSPWKAPCTFLEPYKSSDRLILLISNNPLIDSLLISLFQVKSGVWTLMLEFESFCSFIGGLYCMLLLRCSFI